MFFCPFLTSLSEIPITHMLVPLTSSQRSYGSIYISLTFFLSVLQIGSKLNCNLRLAELHVIPYSSPTKFTTFNGNIAGLGF